MDRNKNSTGGSVCYSNTYKKLNIWIGYRLDVYLLFPNLYPTIGHNYACRNKKIRNKKDNGKRQNKKQTKGLDGKHNVLYVSLGVYWIRKSVYDKRVGETKDKRLYRGMRCIVYKAHPLTEDGKYRAYFQPAKYFEDWDRPYVTRLNEWFEKTYGYLPKHVPGFIDHFQ